MAEEELASDDAECQSDGKMKTSSSLQHMLAVIAEERKRENNSFTISGGKVKNLR